MAGTFGEKRDDAGLWGKDGIVGDMTGFSGAAGMDAVAADVADNAAGEGAASPPRKPRKTRSDGWTAEKRFAFFRALEETCDVKESAKRVGMHVSTAYDLRARDPSFCREWMQAINRAVMDLELELLRQAKFGTEREEVTRTGNGPDAPVTQRKTIRTYAPAQALRVIAAHRMTAVQVRAQEAIEEARVAAEAEAARKAAEAAARPDAETAVEWVRAEVELVRAKLNAAGAGEGRAAD